MVFPCTHYYIRPPLSPKWCLISTIILINFATISKSINLGKMIKNRSDVLILAKICLAAHHNLNTLYNRSARATIINVVRPSQAINEFCYIHNFMCTFKTVIYSIYLLYCCYWINLVKSARSVSKNLEQVIPGAILSLSYADNVNIVSHYTILYNNSTFSCIHPHCKV